MSQRPRFNTGSVLQGPEPPNVVLPCRVTLAKALPFAFATVSDAPAAIESAPPVMLLVLLPVRVKLPPLMARPFTNVFKPSFENVTAPSQIVTAPPKLLSPVLLNVSAPAPSFVNEAPWTPPAPPKT